MIKQQGFNIFGFTIKKNKQELPPSFISPSYDDGSTIISNASAHYGIAFDVEGSTNEHELIKKYRESSMYADCDAAIQEIVNESLVSDPQEPTVSIDLNDVSNLSDQIKKKIATEFDSILRLLKFKNKGHDIFRQWYVDGRLYFHIVLDVDNKKGIYELRLIDPRKIKRIKNITKERNQQGVDIIKDVEEFYLYNDNGINDQVQQGVKISLDSILYINSGITDSNNVVLSHLNKAIKPVNQLKMMEDSLVIYRISRAPERRVFYIDVGNLPKQKAEQYVTDMMNKFRNKIVFDATTGEIKDNKQHLAITEDFWLPRREGKGTEISTLPPAQNLSEISDIQYFQRKLYQALNVPINRLDVQNSFSIGRAMEITREEVKFNKFINKLRLKFCQLFKDALRVQLILKGIIRSDEWDDIEYDINFQFNEDNNFAELKQSELLNNRLSALQMVDQYVGKYYSIQWVRKHILQQTDQEIAELDEQIAKEQPEMDQNMDQGQDQYNTQDVPQDVPQDDQGE